MQSDTLLGSILFCLSLIGTLAQSSEKTNSIESSPSRIRAGRCGVQDHPSPFVLGNPWKKKHFTWKLLNQYVPFFGHGTARALLHQSFNDWSKYAPITFQEVNEYDQSDFELSFLPTYHDPLRRFDGVGGTLAYAYFPPSGVIRFEAEEPWTDRYDDPESFNFRVVATHEIGHALGLDHSNDHDSIMFERYRLIQPNQFLPYDDRQGIQTLYGVRRPAITPYSTVRTWHPTTTMPRKTATKPTTTTRRRNPITTVATRRTIKFSTKITTSTKRKTTTPRTTTHETYTVNVVIGDRRSTRKHSTLFSREVTTVPPAKTTQRRITTVTKKKTYATTSPTRWTHRSTTSPTRWTHRSTTSPTRWTHRSTTMLTTTIWTRRRKWRWWLWNEK